MDIISFSKTEYLLHTSISLLQTESQDWLEDISFWKDELAFFSSFLVKKRSDRIYPVREIQELEKELAQITSLKLDTIKKELKNHDASLTALLLSTSNTDGESDRLRHHVLQKEMSNMHTLIRNFKRNVYLFIQKYEQDEVMLT